MTSAVPGLRGLDHVGVTVPDIDQAVDFFCTVLGAELVYRNGPFVDEGTWFTDELALDPKARIPAMAMLRCGHGASFEIFQYEAPDQRQQLPRMSDWGGHHLAFYVDDMATAVAAIREHGIQVLGSVKPGYGPEGGPNTSWVFCLSPWGLPIELVSYPDGRDYQAGTTARLWHAAHPEL